MNELTVKTDSDRITVSARELHEALEIKTAFKDWFPRMCEYGFEEGSDFRSFLSESTGGRPSTDAEITIEMAKQICMLQRSETGKKYREYFLQIEKDWNSPEKVMARALQMAEREIASLGKQIEFMKPKALFADAVETSKTSILIGDLAKLIKQNGKDIGQNRLFQWLRDQGYLIKGGSNKNMPTQKAMDLGLFEVKERTINNPDGSIRITRTTKVTGKRQVYFINKLVAS